MSVLIVGCGYLGLRAAKLWLAAGQQVHALTRGRADALRAEGIIPVVGDVTHPESLKLPHTDTVLYAVGMDRSSGRTMQEVYVQGLRNVIEALGVASRQTATRFLYVSSTGVYGQTDGSWIDETSPTIPLEESGRVVLEAEAALKELRPDAVVLRFTGLYGSGRVLRRAALLADEPVPGSGEKFVNLIHADDGARAVLAAEARGTPGETYLIADDAPPTRRELFTLTAELIGAALPVFVGGGGVEANRRVRNTKAKERLGWVPQYPTIREGLPASL